MKRHIVSALSALSLLLTGCATSIRSEVTTFQQWPSTLAEKTFVFEAPAAQDADLEYGTYQKLVALELNRLGFSEGSTNGAAFKVSMEYGVALRSIMVSQPLRMDPFWYYSSPYFLRWHRPGYRGYIVDPFWMDRSAFEYRAWDDMYYQRQLHIKISQTSDGKNLFDTKVDNFGVNAALVRAMPYMIRSAFVDFPGRNGLPHHVVFTTKKE